MWAGYARRLQKMVGGQLDVLQLVGVLLEKLSIEELELFFVQAWLILSQRNSIIHGEGGGGHARPISAEQESYRIFRRI